MEPVTFECLPLSHRLHAREAGVLAYVPAPHGLHGSCESTLQCPAAHAEHVKYAASVSNTLP